MDKKNQGPQNQRPQNQRPLSPHIGIYRPQITSMLSILHRLTGVALYLGFILFMWMLVYFAYTPIDTYTGVEFFSCIWWKAALFGWSFCIFYHLLNGIRHLCWDVGMGYDISTTTKSGIFVIISSVALTVASWYFALYC